MAEKSHPKNTFHLIDGIKSNQTLHWISNKNGYRLYKNYTFKVGQDYGYDQFTDEELKQLRNYETRKYYDPSLETLCKLESVEYRIESCKQCGGRVKYIYFNPLEFVDA